MRAPALVINALGEEVTRFRAGQLVRLVEQGRLDLGDSVSDVVPLAEAAQAVERVEKKEGDPIRIVLRP